jgi:hypothetical protein
MPIIVHLHLQLSTTHSEEKDMKAFLSGGPFPNWAPKNMASRDGVFPRFKSMLYIFIADARSKDARTSEKPFLILPQTSCVVVQGLGARDYYALTCLC